MTPTKLPCIAEITSNQYHAEAICHALGVGADSRPMALLEYKDGDVRVLHLDGCYGLKLLRSIP